MIKKKLNDSGIQVLKWPAKSCDLNIIENVFGYLKYELGKHIH